MQTTRDWLQTRLGYACRDLTLFDAALTHRSAGNAHNERLEFLGDAILNCVVAKMLFQTFMQADEGELSRFRATLVSGEALATIATELAVGTWVHLGPGELKSGGFRRKSILADTLEAIFGAIYLDSGFAAAAAVIERLFASRMHLLPSAAELKDPKSRLQEALQARGLERPEYFSVSLSGEPHAQRFVMCCKVQALNIEEQGEGGSRRAAEQAAAQRVLARLLVLWDTQNATKHP